MIFEYVADNMPKRTKPFTSKEYKAYILAVHLLTQKMRDNSKALNSKISRSLKLTKGEKEKFVLQRAELLTQKNYDPSTQEVFEKRIRELSEIIENLKHQKQEIGKNVHQKIRSFTKFLELSQNLHPDWLNADLAKKAKISEKLVLNLTLESRKIRSQTWSAAFDDWLNGPNFRSGTPQGTVIEPCVFHYWTAFQRHFNFWADFADALDKRF